MAEATWQTLTRFGIEKRVCRDLLKHRVTDHFPADNGNHD